MTRKKSTKRSKPAPRKKVKLSTKKVTPSKKTAHKAVPKKRPSSSTRKKPKPKKQPPLQNSNLVIVDDDIHYDPQREAEERRAYLEEARSQEASD